MERSSLAGALLGAFGFLVFTGAARAEPGRVLYGLPSPQEITAYTAAICSAVTCIVNTLYFAWHRLHGAPKPRKPRRKPKPDDQGTKGDDAPTPPAP
jgi:hypothetical protein